MEKKIRPFNYLFLIITASIFINPVHGSYGGEGTKNKAEKITKFKTQKLTNYVNLTVNFLNSTEKINQRHLILFTNCQKLLNGSKKTVKGKDKKNLVSCNNLMNRGTYFYETNLLTKDSSQQIKNMGPKELKENQNKRSEERQLEEKRLKELRQRQLEEKRLKELKQRQLEEKRLEELRQRQLEEKRLEELRQRQLEEKRQKRIKKDSNLLFN